MAIVIISISPGLCKRTTLANVGSAIQLLLQFVFLMLLLHIAQKRTGCDSGLFEASDTSRTFDAAPAFACGKMVASANQNAKNKEGMT
jgi:hypothetical protein